MNLAFSKRRRKVGDQQAIITERRYWELMFEVVAAAVRACFPTLKAQRREPYAARSLVVEFVV